jgi:small subunit ribosomal protein S6
MGSYESTVSFHPDLGEAGVKDLVDRIQEIVAGSGGSVRQVVEWGLRDLAYPIRRQRRGTFWVVVYDGDGSVVNELERNLRISEQVLRYITVKIDPDRRPLELGKARPDFESEEEESDAAGGAGDLEDEAGPTTLAEADEEQ